MRLVIVASMVFLMSVPARQSRLHIVRIEGMDFTPKELSIKAGDQVRWINVRDDSHNVVANDGSFKSAMFEKSGQTFEFTFTKTGAFHYYCRPHRIMGMKGVITVN